MANNIGDILNFNPDDAPPIDSSNNRIDDILSPDSGAQQAWLYKLMQSLHSIFNQNTNTTVPIRGTNEPFINPLESHTSPNNNGSMTAKNFFDSIDGEYGNGQ